MLQKSAFVDFYQHKDKISISEVPSQVSRDIRAGLYVCEKSRVGKSQFQRQNKDQFVQRSLIWDKSQGRSLIQSLQLLSGSISHRIHYKTAHHSWSIALALTSCLGGALINIAMKYSIAAVVSALAAGAAALPFPSAYTLVADGGWTVVTDGTHAFIGTGDIDNYPILILRGGNNNSKITGAAQHRSSAGVQHFYVMGSTDAPVTLTSPNADAPSGAVVAGFGVDNQNYLTVNGKSNAFGVDPNSDQIREIYHLGKGSGSQYQPISLWVKECKGC